MPPLPKCAPKPARNARGQFVRDPRTLSEMVDYETVRKPQYDRRASHRSRGTKS